MLTRNIKVINKIILLLSSGHSKNSKIMGAWIIIKPRIINDRL